MIQKVSKYSKMQNPKMKNLLKLQLIVALSLFSGLVLAQQPEKNYQEEVTIIGSYTPTITDAHKINTNPVIENEKFEIPTLTYSISPVQLNTNIELEKIKPAKMIGEPISKLYPNYIAAGYGNYGTPFFQFFVNSKRDEETQFGVHLKHLSSNSDLKNFKNSTFSHNLAEVWLKKFYKNHTLSTGAFFKRDVVHYYGFEQAIWDSTLLSKDQIKQSYKTFGLNALLSSNYNKENKLGHKVGLKYYYLSDDYKSSESGINFSAGIDKGMQLFEKNYSKFALDMDLDFYANKDSINSNSDGVFRLNPYVNLNFGQYQFKVGFTTAFGLDSNSKVDIFPDIKALVMIVPKYLTAFAGFTGSIEKSSYRKFTTENPFVISNIPLAFTKNKMEIYGGITGNVAKVVDYTIRLSSSSYENMPFFIGDSSQLNNAFTAIYDDCSVMNAHFEIGYRHAEKLRFRLAADYFNYSPDSLAKAYYKPEYKVNLGVDYNIGDKIILNGEVIAYGGMDALVIDPTIKTNFQEKQIDGWLDLNLGVEFRYTKNLSFFANFNNVGNTEYMRWYNYQAQKFNFLGGVTYSF
jgi:hypothetical protein